MPETTEEPTNEPTDTPTVEPVEVPSEAETSTEETTPAVASKNITTSRSVSSLKTLQRPQTAVVKKLDPATEILKLQKTYNETSRNKSFNALIYGKSGAGKTYALRTARTPILVDSFDPGGSKALAAMAEAGEALLDTRWETDNNKKPETFALWDKELERRIQGGFFNHFGTYVIDSATTWATRALRCITMRANRPLETPQYNDYLPQMHLIELALLTILALPCDFILIAHVEGEKDDVTGVLSGYPAFTGKLAGRVPNLFDEVFYASADNKASGHEYTWQTKLSARYVAKTRIDSLRTEPIPTMVPQNFKKLFKGTMYDRPNLPNLHTLTSGE